MAPGGYKYQPPKNSAARPLRSEYDVSEALSQRPRPRPVAQNHVRFRIRSFLAGLLTGGILGAAAAYVATLLMTTV